MKRRVFALLLSSGLGLAIVMVMGVPAEAGGTVIPPHARPVGASYGQWDARWWQWLYQTPVQINPVLSSPAGTPVDPAAVDCTAGQSGHVWFIGGTFLPTSSTPQVLRSDVYRTCTIPTGTFLFFPVLNGEFDNLGCPNTSYSAEQLIAAAALGIDDIVPGSMTATIDGASVSGLANGKSIYRAPSPWFSYTLPADNIGPILMPPCNFPAGTSPPPVDGHPGATADGIYLMLASGLHPEHQLHHHSGPEIAARPRRSLRRGHTPTNPGRGRRKPTANRNALPSCGSSFRPFGSVTDPLKGAKDAY
jgi:hypothetical protein